MQSIIEQQKLNTHSLKANASTCQNPTRIPSLISTQASITPQLNKVKERASILVLIDFTLHAVSQLIELMDQVNLIIKEMHLQKLQPTHSELQESQ